MEGDGGFVVIGTYLGPIFHPGHPLLARMDIDGTISQIRYYRDLSNQQIEHAVPTGEGGYFVVGNDFKLFIGEIDPADALIELSRLNHIYGASVVVNGFDVVVAGVGGIPGSRLMRIAKVDRAGLDQWMLDVPLVGDEEVHAIAEAGNGDILVAGAASEAPSTALRYLLVLRTTGGGALQWVKTFDGVPDEGAYSIVEAGDSSIYLAGRETLLKLDADGNEVWRIAINGTILDLTMAADGTLLAAGYREIETADVFRSRMLLLKVNDAGTILLERTYDGVPFE